MVALSGRGWRLAPALVALMSETDRLFPNRSTASDGSIGDPAHQARTSDHNPDGGWVDAVDITDDDAHGCDVAVLVHHLVASKDDRIKYLIHNGTIWQSPGFAPHPYTGPNAHKRHAHVSINNESRFTTRAWWPQSKPTPPKPPPIAVPQPEDDDMAYIIPAVGTHPTQLWSGPILVPLKDPRDMKAAEAAGCKKLPLTKPVVDDIKSQVVRILAGG